MIDNPPVVPKHQSLEELGLAAYRAGDLSDAESLAQSALLANADSADAYELLGAIHSKRKNFLLALPLLLRAAELSPEKAQFHFNLGVVHAELLSLSEAMQSYAKALALEPGHIHALSNQADLLRRHDRPQEAMQLYERIRSINHQTKGLTLRLAVTYFDLRCDHEAEHFFKLAVKEAADAELHSSTELAQIHWEYAHFLLLKKQFALGWAAYEYRSLCDAPIAVPHFPHTQPLWRGEPLHAKTLLVYREQGLGDEIMFGSLIAQAAADANRLIIVASPGMVGLWQSTFDSQNTMTDKVLVFADWYPQPPLWDSPPAPAWLAASQIDFQCSMGRLALLQRPTQASFEDPQISLAVDPALVLKWQVRLDLQPEFTGKSRVGLMWRANPMLHCFDGSRRSIRKSVPLQEFQNFNPRPARLQLVSLANSEHAQELKSDNTVPLLDFSQYLSDVAETGALIKNLDLIITVDTSLAHLAGALGLKVWLLLAHTADWRWGEIDSTSYWYQNVRIFRQTTEGDWASLLTTVSNELGDWVDSRDGSAVMELALFQESDLDTEPRTLRTQS